MAAVCFDLPITPLLPLSLYFWMAKPEIALTLNILRLGSLQRARLRTDHVVLCVAETFRQIF
jgi:hypothetical protein